MKYRSISLNGNKDDYYSLVKYKDEYKDFLVELKKMNKKLAYVVEHAPKIFSESSDHQSYMIFRNGNFEGEYQCVGAIGIETSTDEKNLEVGVELNEKYFRSKSKMVELIEQLVDSLKLFFYDKENIEINLINDIDLSKINALEFSKKVYDEKLTTYICENKINNELIPKLTEEITRAKNNLSNCSQGWWEDEKNYVFSDIDANIDKELINEINGGFISYPEMFSKVEKIYWKKINSLRSTRKISFYRDGNIKLIKYSKNNNKGIYYEFAYNILGNSFNLKSQKYGGENVETLDIDENPYYTNIKTDKLNILEPKDGNKKRITFISPIVDNSSISLELWVDKQNEIKGCYIDFRTHRNNNKKINGLYALRIEPEQDHFKFSIRFISRKGNAYGDFSCDLLKTEEELFSTIIDGKFTIELINELIRKVIPIINIKAKKYKKPSIPTENITVIPNFLNTFINTIDFLSQIKGEIPLPHLQNILNEFVIKNSENKKDIKKRILK